MNRLLITTALAVAVAVPATASAKPSKTDKRNAQQECRAERGSTDETREAFRVKYGTGSHGRNAFGKCVSRTTRDEHAERHAARRAAKEACRQERGEARKRCMKAARADAKAAADAEDRQERADRRNAAKACDAERGETQASRDAFQTKYGTNRNRRNAFGKCVSQQAKTQADDRREDDTPAAQAESHRRGGAQA